MRDAPSMPPEQEQQDVRRSRARWRRASVALLALLLVAVGWAAYALLDQGVTLTYERDSYDHLRRDVDVLARLAPVAPGGVSRGQLLDVLRRQHPGALITASDSTVGIGQLEFHFGADGRLRAVSHPELGGAAPSGRS
jgi:hypothetical protein